MALSDQNLRTCSAGRSPACFIKAPSKAFPSLNFVAAQGPEHRGPSSDPGDPLSSGRQRLGPVLNTQEPVPQKIGIISLCMCIKSSYIPWIQFLLLTEKYTASATKFPRACPRSAARSPAGRGARGGLRTLLPSEDAFVINMAAPLTLAFPGPP